MNGLALSAVGPQISDRGLPAGVFRRGPRRLTFQLQGPLRCIWGAFSRGHEENRVFLAGSIIHSGLQVRVLDRNNLVVSENVVDFHGREGLRN